MKSSQQTASVGQGNSDHKHTPTVAPHRFQALDSWRGLCALLVVFYHFRVISHFSALAIVTHGDVAVDFFFVLSGFVLAHAYSGRLKQKGEVRVFTVRRLGRLYPLHFVTLAVLVLVEIAHFGLTTITGHAFYRAAFAGPTSLPSLMANLFLIHGLGIFREFSWNVPSWSISVELYVSLLFAVILTIRYSKLLLLCVLAIAFIVRVVLWVNKIWPYEGDLSLIRGICGFFLGVQAYKLFTRLGPNFKIAAQISEFLVPFAFGTVIAFDDHGCGFLDPLIFAALVIVFGVQSGLISRLLRAGGLQYLGKISYSIYMVHYVIITVVFGAANIIGSKIGVSLKTVNSALVIDAGPMWMGDTVQIILVTAVVGCAALAYNFVETPGRVLFDKLLRMRSR